MARFIKERKFQCSGGIIYVDEYVTKWEVVAKGYGHQFPCATAKYMKRECATANDAAQRLANELNW
jgi:hypothetical protein